MSLPSQTGRPKARRSHMYSRRRHRPIRWILGGLASVAVAVGFWWFWPGNDHTSNTNEPLTQVGTLDTTNTLNPAVSSKANSNDLATKARETPTQPTYETPQTQNTRPAAPEPMKLVMGQPGPVNDLPPQSTNIRAETPAVQQQPQITETARPATNSFNAPAENRPAAGVASSTPSSERTSDAAQSTIQSALASLEARPVESRLILSKALGAADVSDADQKRIRDALTKINDVLVFSPSIVPGDPFAIAYSVQSGDLLQKIVRNHSLQVDWRLIARINNVDPRRIRVGQRMKLITGPFHAIVHKSDFRLDLYLGDGSQQVYVRSFNVGLGEYNSTPEGLFRVRPQSKAINPAWVNPRTGEAFDAEDPKNPIGEHWIGLEAVDEALKDVIGYGIHGTTDPESIGLERSMGCVRLHDEDIELLYELLVEETSLVRIVR